MADVMGEPDGGGKKKEGRESKHSSPVAHGASRAPNSQSFRSLCKPTHLDAS